MPSIPIHVLTFVTTVALFSWTTPATAGVLISIADALVPEGGVAYVDVSIESDSTAGDPLSIFGFEFRISTAGATQLDFLDPQSDSQLSSGSYMFAGDSLADLFPPVGTVGTTVVPNDTYFGGDGTASGGNVLVGALARLMVRLEVTTNTLLPPVAGDQFSIELIPGPNTFFIDSEFNDIAYSSAPGTISIVAVPEPASCSLLLIGSLFVVPWLSSAIGARQARLSRL